MFHDNIGTKHHFIRLSWGIIEIIFIKSLEYINMCSVTSAHLILKGAESEVVKN